MGFQGSKELSVSYMYEQDGYVIENADYNTLNSKEIVSLFRISQHKRKRKQAFKMHTNQY